MVFFSEVFAATEKEIPLKTSWQPQYPYQYLQNENNLESVTGLDIQLTKILAQTIKRRVSYQAFNWQATLEALKSGTLDFSANATYSKERASYAYFSIPYRFEEDALFVLSSKANLYKFKTISEFLAYIKLKQHSFRLGVSKGFLYADPLVNLFIQDPNNNVNLVYAENRFDNLQKLLLGEIDGFLMDRMVGASFMSDEKYGGKIAEITLNMRTPIHFMFSKKTVSEETVLAFNKAITLLKEQKSYENLITWYLYPVILLQTVDARWFQMIDMLGTLFFSISGVLIAHKQRATVFAAFVYAVLPSLGGGLLRDVIFGQRPVGVLTTPLYLWIVVITVLLGFLISKVFGRIESSKKPYKHWFLHLKASLVICDAFGLAAFTVVGVLVSLVARVEPLWLWGPFFSFLTGAGGTIIRDIVSKNKKLADIEGEIYSEIAILWGLFLSVGLSIYASNIQPEIVKTLVLLTVGGAFVTRLLVYFLKVPNVQFK